MKSKAAHINTLAVIPKMVQFSMFCSCILLYTIIHIIVSLNSDKIVQWKSTTLVPYHCLISQVNHFLAASTVV